jgi:hypothetical protein
MKYSRVNQAMQIVSISARVGLSIGLPLASYNNPSTYCVANRTKTDNISIVHIDHKTLLAPKSAKLYKT